MRTKRRRYIWIPAALAVLTLAAGVWPRKQGSPAHPRRLADGSVLALEAVTYGKSHDFVLGSGWAKLLAPVLPWAMRVRLAVARERHISRHPNALVFWTTRRGGTLSPRGYRAAAEPRVVAFDEQGRETESGHRVHLAFRSPHMARRGSPPQPSSIMVVEGWELSTFPRRGETVGIRLYDHHPGGGWTSMAEFVVPNPTPGPHPTWTPRPLPETHRQGGDVAFTLTGLTTGVDGAGSPRASGGVENWTCATFRITRDGKPTHDWEPVDVTVSDASGNTWTPAVCFQNRRGDGTRLFFRGALWPGEAAYRLRVEFAPGEDTLPGSVWGISRAAVPPRGASAKSIQTARRQGRLLRLMSITSASPVMLNRTRLSLADSDTVFVRLSPPSPNLRLRIVRATDDRGREVPTSRPQSAQFGFLGCYLLRVQLPQGARTVDLSFGVHRQSRFATFLAAPSRPQGTQTRRGQRPDPTAD